MGRYVIEKRLGSGATSTVYLASDETLGRTVALKVLRPRLGGLEARAHFLHEARTAAALASPQIVVVYDVGEWEGRIFIAMEYVPGESLRSLLRAGRLGEARTLALARSMARALVDAHERGIVHRDLKPENLMVAPDGTIKVLDFGLARTDRAEHDAQAVGTRGYMAPEQARGEPVDVRADVYALGVIVREMSTGERPPDAPPENAAAPPVLARERPTIERISRRCCAVDPRDRYPAAGALLRDLERVSSTPRPRRAWAALTFLAALGAGIALASALHSRAGSLPSPPATAQATAHDAAASAYALGRDLLRRGSLPSAANAFTDAVSLDPALAEAHLRLAVFTDLLDREARRAHLSRASTLRERLSDHDAALLAMAQAVVLAEPPDPDALDRAGRQALARFPGDAEVPLAYAVLRHDYVPGSSLDELLERARAADPESALPLWLQAEDQADREDYEGSLRTISRCLEVSPLATSCLRQRAVALEVTGDCARFEADARRMVVVEPESDVAYYRLAVALWGAGAPVDSVREALNKSAVLSRTLPRARANAENAVFLAMIAGDLAQAESAAQALERQAATSSSEQEHALAVATLLRVHEETGDDGAALAVADDYAERSRAWVHDEPFLARPLVEAVRSRRKSADPRAAAAARERAAEEVKRLLPPGMANMAWATAYARGVRSADEARDALAALPRFAPLPRGTSYEPYVVTIPAQAIGHTFALAGRHDEALPWLRQASRSCWFFEAPVEYLRAQVDLGQEQEARGDRAAACASYGVVLDRWKDVRPRSATFSRARERFAALACGVGAAGRFSLPR
jgi:serine/threonine-protein kinase